MQVIANSDGSACDDLAFMTPLVRLSVNGWYHTNVSWTDCRKKIASTIRTNYILRQTSTPITNLNEFAFLCVYIGNALLRRLVRIGVLDEQHMKLDYVLGLKIEDFLERRLQTQVFKLGLAKSIHHARVLIRQRHIR